MRRSKKGNRTLPENQFKEKNKVPQRLNRIGPNTLPWKIPLVTLAFVALLPSTYTVCVLSLRKSWIQEWIVPRIP